MKKIHGANQEEKGAVLVISLLVTVALLIVIMPFLFKLSGEYRKTDRTFKSLAALNLAEAGVERAIWELNFGDISTWSGDSTARTLTLSSVQTSEGDTVGDIVISISNPESSSPIVESTGKILFRNSDTVDRTISVELAKYLEPIFDNALFGNSGITLSGNSFVDSYDSRDGIYGGDNIGSNGHIATNNTSYGCITLENEAIVFGDAKIGENGDPDDILLLNSAVVHGDTSALSASKPMLPIPIPEGLVFKGNYTLDVPTKGGIDTISESGEYSSFVIDDNSIVTIDGDVILTVAGEFSMAKNAEICILEGSSLQLYLGGTFIQNKDSGFNTHTDDPKVLSLFGTEGFASEMIWYSNSSFYGSVFLPSSTFTLQSNIDIYGAMSANYVIVSANARIHYDTALLDVDTLQMELATYYVKSWHEKLIP